MIVEAALDCFNTRGFEDTSISHICEAAGVSRGLIHFHFESKDDLIAEVESLMFRRIAEQVKTSSRRIGPSVKNAEEAFDMVWAQLKESQVLLPAFFGLLGRALTDPKFHDRFTDFYEQNRDLVVDALDALLGPITQHLTVSAEHLAEVLMASIIGLSLVSVYNSDEAHMDALFQTLKTIALSAVPSAVMQMNAPPQGDAPAKQAG